MEDDQPDPIQPWPDPDDVAGWLETLEAGVRLSEEQLAIQRAHLERCRAAADDVASTTASSEASKRLCLLMHGSLVDPSSLDPDEVDEAAPLWTPPTKEQRLERRAAEAKQRAQRAQAEQQRRIALAEQLVRALYGDVRDDEEMQRAREELARHGVTRPRPREPGMLTYVEETMTPQHQDETRER